MRHLTVLAAALAAVLLAACSSAPMSATAAAHATGSVADAALVCHHYMQQRAWVRGLTQPTLADALKIETFVAADAVESEGTGKLHTDVEAMYQAAKAGHDIHALSQRVYRDCAAIGITS